MYIYIYSKAGEINVQVSRAVSELQGEIKTPSEWAGFRQSKLESVRKKRERSI